VAEHVAVVDGVVQPVQEYEAGLLVQFAAIVMVVPIVGELLLVVGAHVGGPVGAGTQVMEADACEPVPAALAAVTP